MKDPLETLFESQVFDENTKNEIKEYVTNKLKETEFKIREEYAKRFEMDKANLVEALDKFVNEAVEEELKELKHEKKMLQDSRAKLFKENMKLREEAKNKLKNTVHTFEKFIMECLAEEIKEFREDRKKYESYKKMMKERFLKERARLREEMKNHLQKLDHFVTEELSKEVHEFAEDKKNLLRAKATFLKESREQLKQAKTIFIKRASQLIENNVENLLKKEILQFRDDINRIRENNFGRKIFEAFGQEFLNSYLAEGTKVKKALQKINHLEKRLVEAENRAKKAETLLESERNRAKKAEMLMERNRKMETLLKPLSGEKRKLMESMLQGVSVENLEKAFSRYLPIVMGKDEKKPILVENREKGGKILVIGNKPVTGENLLESSRDDSNNEIIQLRKLAGLS